ncbi:Integral membrane protein MviN [Tepidanaerobacter acetatoxydans Re1]|uniref:Probable lipid II flippase MurJ n=1 Tax=Tepidanaerobacter acetatoxydans (strain DSM 21804 / JCM 16047 / Re1) TaxID=1209989 RepID=F4LX90_TEPAE|nr:murein biosynthesis integral membrane protein MurJ [Tepidanaerobacter acetatoxydans]AEE91889.1 integral membrane protein MviN [Tepidanaerobacter acetatoxydans Re1]CDI40845.1 Integral membrane protein MviN [Tepidanaerobacter acetatoxydans Re1]
MKKTALLLMIITIVSKIVGFGREITLSYFYGASNISDAFLISLTIPSVIFSFIGTGISTGYIPLYSKIEEKYGEKEGERYTNNLVNILLVLCTGIIIFGLLFTGPLIKMFASGFEGNTLELAIRFTRISLFGIYFTGLINIYGGFLRIKGNYAVPACVGFPMNFFLILSILLSSKTNVMVLAIGSVIATASQLVFLVPFMHKAGYRYEYIFDTKDEYIRRMIYIALPVIIGVSVDQINVLVDRTLASGIAVGGISALNYASKLNGFVQGMFVTTISAVMYPMISKMAVQGNFDGLKSSVSEAINLINLFVVPATFGAMLFAEPIVRLLFGRGAFDPEAISMTSIALFYYSIGMVGFGLREIISRAFYSMQDTKTPMINAAVAVSMNIILNIILSRYMGIGGLALATSLSAIFCTGLLFISLRKKVGPFGMKDTAVSFVKILVSSAGMGIAAYISYVFLLPRISRNLSLIISIFIGALVYSVIVYFIKIKEVDTLVDAAKKKLKTGA